MPSAVGRSSRSRRKISVLVRRISVGLVFDGLATVTPSNAGHMPLVAQPLGLGRLGVALIIFRGSPTKRQRARRRVGADAQLGDAGAGRDPAAPASPMAVANGEHRSGV